MSKIIMCVVPLCLVLFIASCHKKSGGDESEGTPPVPVVSVQTRSVVRGDIREIITVDGHTDAVRKEKILSPIAGTVVSIKEIPGTRIQAGETLAVIISRESQAAINGAKLLMKRATTPEQKEEAQKGLDLSESTKSLVVLRARFRCVLSTRTASMGEMVSENSELLTVVDPATMYFDADIRLRDLPKIHLGQPCFISMQSLAGTMIAATVGETEPVADLQSQSLGLRCNFTKFTGVECTLIKINAAGTAAIVVGVHRGVLLVPKIALLRNDETNTVSLVVVDSGSISKTIQVSEGAATDSMAEVSAQGLHEGMKVVTVGNYGLPDSTKLRVTE